MLYGITMTAGKTKRPRNYPEPFSWEILGSNQRPLPCRGSALNQLS